MELYDSYPPSQRQSLISHVRTMLPMRSHVTGAMIHSPTVPATMHSLLPRQASLLFSASTHQTYLEFPTQLDRHHPTTAIPAILLKASVPQPTNGTSSRDMSSPAKRLHNVWTETQRAALHILITQFDFDATTRTSIFNILFKDDLEKCGIEKGLGDIALESQYRERTRKGRTHLWANVLRGPGTKEEKQLQQQLIGQIHNAATTLGVSTEDASLAAHSPLAEETGELDETSLRPESMRKGATEEVMEMLHDKHLTWKANSPSITTLDGAIIDHASPVYKHGGQVHRVTIESNTNIADFMICDPSACDECSDSANPTLPSKTDGLPFVHSSDTTMDTERTYFRPKPKANSSEIPRTFRRFIQFKGIKGEFGCWVKICGNIGCQVCMWGNLQRNPGLLKRQGLEQESADAIVARKKGCGDRGGEDDASSTIDGT